METKTIVHGKYCVEVGELRFGDERRQMVIGGKLAKFSPMSQYKKGDRPDGYDALLETDMVDFTFAVSQVRSSSGFTVPTSTDTPEDIHAAFEALDELPARFVREWFDAAEALRLAVDDPDLAPPEMLDENQKKAK